MRQSSVWLAVALGALFGPGCAEAEPTARVISITSRAQAVGGPSAVAAKGDYLLENDRIRVVIQSRPRHTGTSTAFGASVIDADLQRAENEFAGGRGLDQFYEIVPTINLFVPQPDPMEVETQFQVVRAESSDEGGALLRVECDGGSLLDILEALADVGLVDILATPEIRLRVDYELRPGENFLRMTATGFLTGDDSLEDVVRMPGFDGTTDLGELFGAQGAFGAWITLLGGELSAFAPGPGYEPFGSLRAAIALRQNVIESPHPFPFFVGVGDRVSYGLLSGEGDLLMPISASAFTLGISDALTCPSDDKTCAERQGVQMTAFFSVGEGDVASAAEPFYGLRGIETGTLDGVVVDQRSGDPISGADVFVLRDPWPELSDVAIRARSYEEVAYANRLYSDGPERPLGEPGVLSQMRSDVGTSPQRDGSFRGVVPADESGTRYILIAHREGRLSGLQPVRVTGGQVSQVVMVMPEMGSLSFEIRNESGQPSPGKVSVGQCMPECAFDADCAHRDKVCDPTERRCVPPGGCTEDAQCDPDERCDAASGTCTCEGLGQIPRELGGDWIVDGVIRAAYTVGGRETMELPPGTYELVFSRGLEYGIDRQTVRVEPSRSVEALGAVHRVVETEGWVSADFHVHGARSSDSGVDLTDRIRSYLGEGVEFLSSSDHDALTRYQPIIRENGWDGWIASQIGLEVSPLMLSHFLGFPLAYDENEPQGMPADKALDWISWDEEHGHYHKNPMEVVADLREAGALGGGGDAVVVIPHVYDYFNYFGLDAFNLSLDPGIFGLFDLFPGDEFESAFDGFEIVNGKSQDYIHLATVSEVADYNTGLESLSERLIGGEIDLEDYVAEHQVLGREIVGRMLARTPEEQSAFIDATEAADCSCLPACADTPEMSGAADHPCDAFFGVVAHWYRMLNHGIRYVGLANSDSHDLYHGEAGIPRNWVRSPTDLPSQLDQDEMSLAVARGAVVASYGPFIQLSIEGREVGQIVEMDPAGGVDSITLSVDVQSPLWFDVDRVELYRNGRVIKVWEGCDVADDEECVAVPNDAVKNLSVTWTDSPSEDAWYLVAAMGTRGKHLAPVYSSEALARLGFEEAFDSLSGVLNIGLEPSTIRSPSVHPILPFGMTNPIWVDVLGDGFTPPGPGEASAAPTGDLPYWLE